MNRLMRCDGKSTTMSAVAYGYINLSRYGVQSVGIQVAVHSQDQNQQVIKPEMVLGLESGSHLCHMSYWASRSSNVASSNSEERMTKRKSKIPVINLDNIDEYFNRGFIDCTNIQEEE